MFFPKLNLTYLVIILNYFKNQGQFGNLVFPFIKLNF